MYYPIQRGFSMSCNVLQLQIGLIAPDWNVELQLININAMYYLQDDAVINFSQQTKMNLEWSKRYDWIIETHADLAFHSEFYQTMYKQRSSLEEGGDILVIHEVNIMYILCNICILFILFRILVLCPH